MPKYKQSKKTVNEGETILFNLENGNLLINSEIQTLESEISDLNKNISDINSNLIKKEATIKKITETLSGYHARIIDLKKHFSKPKLLQETQSKQPNGQTSSEIK